MSSQIGVMRVKTYLAEIRFYAPTRCSLLVPDEVAWGGNAIISNASGHYLEIIRSHKLKID